MLVLSASQSKGFSQQFTNCFQEGLWEMAGKVASENQNLILPDAA